jgi:peptidoglycan/LPS O-acetylase OafA/YrhL
MHDNNFNLLRLMAATQVMLLHGLTHFNLLRDTILYDILAIFPGVPIFFVLSGYLISNSWIRTTDYKRYFVSRFLRIYPGLWVCLIIAMPTAYYIAQPNAALSDILKWTVAMFTVGQSYSPYFMESYGSGHFNGSLWTIMIELQFYLAAPILISYILKNRVSMIVVFALAVAANLLFAQLLSRYGYSSVLMKLFSNSLAPYLYMFLLGVFIQIHKHTVVGMLKNRFHYILGLYLVVVMGLNALGLETTGTFISPIQGVILACLTISFGYSFPKFLNSPIQHIDISYGVYIYHMVITNVLIQTGLATGTLGLTIMLVSTILLGTASWYAVEKPALRLKHVF